MGNQADCATPRRPYFPPKLQIEAPAKVEAEVLVATVHGAMLSARAHADPALFNMILQPALRRLSARTR